MIIRKAYSKQSTSGCMYSFLTLRPFFLFLFLFTINNNLVSQDLPEYDEIAIFLEVPRIGGTEIDVLIKDKELYLPVVDLFSFLKIKNNPSTDMASISGFIINPDAEYVIDRINNRITYQDKSYDLSPGDLVRTGTNLYLKSTLFGKVFGLNCTFNFRSLSVTVESKLELPLIREMRQEEMRRNISRLKGDVVADTTIDRTYPLFKFGMADWSAYASEEINGKSDARLNLALGSMIAGGEATASLYYYSGNKFNEKQQYYLWRYVNNDFAPLRQIMAGKIRTNSISSIYNPVIGVQLTNTPTTYRRSFGTYTISDKTEPGWIVELYVNNVLIDYVKADASGFFNLEIPLVYGNSHVILKFFGPWGEERTREQNIIIPYNFLPEKTFEYNLSSGIVEDTLKSRFSRASFNYGATRNLTIGGGAEYFSAISSQPFMPYLNASLRLTNNLLLSGEYAFGVRAKGTLSYRLPSNLQLDLNYTWYNKDQKAIFYNYREERKATLSMPVKIGKFSSFNRLSVYQIVLPASKYTTAEWLISGSLYGVNTNLTTYSLFINEVKPYVYSNLAIAFRLPLGFILMPQTQFSYTENKFLSAKAKLEKHVMKNGYINLSYEQNFRNNLKLAEAGFRYDFSFAQAGTSVRQYNERTSFIHYARGSFINDRRTKYLGTDNRTNVGRGGISVIAFLDLNLNGKRDAGEPKAHDLNLHTNGGRIEKNDRDTTVRILGLEPYTKCFIELDPNSFENISWRFEKLSYSVAVDPNILKLIEIPVTVAGEATGYVFHETDGEKKGQGRILVNFYDKNQNFAGKTLSESDGYYSYFGLSPGKYTVRIDTAQLNNLNLISVPDSLQFILKGGTDGDFVEGLDFVLMIIPADTTEIIPVATEKPVAVTDTSYLILHELSEDVYTITEDSWAIQIGAFMSREYAEGFEEMLEKELGKDVQITIAGDYYRVRILDLPTRDEVDENVEKLNKLGFKELWIIHLLAKQQERILISREDSLALIKQTPVEGEIPLSDAEKAELQLSVFRFRSNSIALKEPFSAPFDEKNLIERGGIYYKLETPHEPILKQTTLESIDDLLTEVGKFELKDDWEIPPPKEIFVEPVRPEPVSIMNPPLIPLNSITVKAQVPSRLIIEEKPIITEPSIALQVAVYHRESQALRAQKRIMSKLNLPVEIVKQWDYYHVIVTGFYSREETYQYYPELTELGYPGITLIENYRRQK